MKKRNFGEIVNSYPLLIRLMLMFIAMATLPMIFIETYNYLYTRDIIEKKAIALINSNASEGANQISKIILQYEMILLTMMCDNTFISWVKHINSSDQLISATAYSELYSQVSRTTNFAGGIRSVIITTPKGKEVYFDRYLQQRVNINVNELYEAALKDNRSFSQSRTLLSEYPNGAARDGNEYLFSMTRLLYDIYSNEVLGSLTLVIDESEINRIFDNIGSHMNYNDRHMFLLDGSGNILLSDVSGMDAAVEFSELEYRSLDTHFYKDIGGKTYIFQSSPVDKAQWTLITGLNKNYVTNELIAALKLYISITALSLILIILIFSLLLTKVTRSIGNVLEIMKRVAEGNFSERLSVKPENEFTRIADSFNDMTDKIDSLMLKLQRQTELVRFATEKEKNAEIQALEAQLNPHFLYNTLDTINWIAIEKGEYEISNMLKQLASMLRYSINKSNTTVPIYQEAEWLHEYLYLQKKRFSDSFIYEINIDDDVMDYKIHKLLFQPIVENAVVHAFSKMDEGGRLEITGCLNCGMLEFVISDNGSGMSADQIECLRGEGGEGDEIGIRNVMGRLKMYYNGDAEFDVKSVTSEGTRVLIRLPAYGKYN